MMRTRWAALLLLMSASLSHSGAELAPVRVTGRVVDAVAGTSVSDAVLTVGADTVRADARGLFELDTVDGAAIHVRAPGYLRTEALVDALRGPEAQIRLTPFQPKALYLSAYGIGDKQLRTDALKLIDTTELNALVIDLKGDRGIVPYRSTVSLATAVGAQRVITIGNLAGLVNDLRSRGIYTIARIVVFKDTLLAQGRPDLAIRKRDGSMFHDDEDLAWTNPYSHEVWSYNIGIAVEAAKAGFDEIQFDYVRFPDATGLAYELPWTEQNREAAIDGFLNEARKTLLPFNVFLAADVFGYVCWNLDDTKIGQKLEDVAAVVDYVSPMLYPSSFQYGIPGYRDPVQHPYEIVHLTLERARDRTHLPAVRFRPWLQAFRDYAFGGQPFSGGEVRLQINAAEEFRADGWMLWNPHNQYSAADFKP